MIFKVYFQSKQTQVPVRENTDSVFVEAESEEDVRKKLSDRGYNIEYITVLTGNTLAYEQKDENYKLENI